MLMGPPCGASGGARGWGERRPKTTRRPPHGRHHRCAAGVGGGVEEARGGPLAGAGAVGGHAATSVRRGGSTGRRRGLRTPEERTVGHPCGSPGGRKRWMHASAGSVSRFHRAPRRGVTRNVTGPSSRVSRRVVVRAIREREGAQEVRPSVPVPAGWQGVPQCVCQTWGGPSVERPAGGRAALHVPRQRVESARTGTRPASQRGESPGTPSGDRAPPGTRSGPGGGEARALGQGWRTPPMPICPPRERGSSVRACKAAAEVCKRRGSRQRGGERAPGRSASGSGTVTRQSGTGRRSARCWSSPRGAVAC